MEEPDRRRKLSLYEKLTFEDYITIFLMIILIVSFMLLYLEKQFGCQIVIEMLAKFN